MSKDEPKEAKAERPKPAARSRKPAPEKPVEEMSIDEMIQTVDEPGPEAMKKSAREIEESSEDEPVRRTLIVGGNVRHVQRNSVRFD